MPRYSLDYALSISFEECTFFTFQILTAVLWKMQVFWYVTMQSVML